MATIEVCDDVAYCTADTLQVTVENVAASVEADSNRTVDEGAALELEPSSFSDVSILDTHTATIDWGDGSALDSGTVADGTGTFPVHFYADKGEYTETVCVIDNSDDSGCDELTIAVADLAPTVEAGSDVTMDEGQWQVTVKICVTDDDEGIGCDVMTATVSSVALIVDAGSAVTVDEGAVMELAPAAFKDQSTLDTHTATKNWGNSSALGWRDRDPNRPVRINRRHRWYSCVPGPYLCRQQYVHRDDLRH